MNTHERAARLCPSPKWAAICAGQRVKGLEKHKRTVESHPGTAAYWARHSIEEDADSAVYALRLADSGHRVRGYLAAFLSALAARLLLPLIR